MRVVRSAQVEATRDAVLVGIVKIALKSWVECVRLTTLGRAGFQQLQARFASLI